MERMLIAKGLGFIVACLVPKSCLTLGTPWTVGHQAPLSVGFPGNNWSVLYFSSPGDLPNSEREAVSPELAGAGRLFTTEPAGKP